jgi:hypothetical protein
VAAKDLFRELSTAKQPVTPFRFLSTLRELYPQFGQTGQGGTPMQQDAEECYTQVSPMMGTRAVGKPFAVPAGALPVPVSDKLYRRLVYRA